MTVNSSIAATTISEPAMGAASTDTTTLTHIINDPIIGLSLYVPDFAGPPAERGAHALSSSL
jgi:hypothetical protein